MADQIKVPTQISFMTTDKLGRGFYQLISAPLRGHVANYEDEKSLGGSRTIAFSSSIPPPPLTWWLLPSFTWHSVGEELWFRQVFFSFGPLVICPSAYFVSFISIWNVSLLKFIFWMFRCNAIHFFIHLIKIFVCCTYVTPLTWWLVPSFTWHSAGEELWFRQVFFSFGDMPYV